MATDKHHLKHHDLHHSTSLYWLIWGALILLSGLTYFSAKQDFGHFNLPLALGIATLKAGLVVAFFMHLKDTKGAPLVSFTVSIVLVLTLIGGVFGDIVFRNPMSRPDKVPNIQDPPLGYSLEPTGADGHIHSKDIGNPKGIRQSNP